jgi:hypothetical protein
MATSGHVLIQPTTWQDEVKLTLLGLFRDERGVRAGLFCEVQHRMDFNQLIQRYDHVPTPEEVEGIVNELLKAGLIEASRGVCAMCKAYGYSAVDHAPAFKLTAAGHDLVPERVIP